MSLPKWLPDNVVYLTKMGSVAYGVSNTESDIDIYGCCVPPKVEVFPHLRGEINGFGKQKKKFEQWQQHKILDVDTKKEYDFTIYNIVKFFSLCMENNPNMIDSLYTPIYCVLQSTNVGNLIRENRKIFLHKGCWHKFKGYAYSQLHKMTTKNPEGKRKITIEKYGFDVKYAYHIVRLLDECEQILETGDMDLQRSRELLKSIRRGEKTQEWIREYFDRQEKRLQELYDKSDMQHSPDENAIKQLLLRCLEEHYGSLKNCVVDEDVALKSLREIQDILDKI